MDELQISGKRFISSRRIARENGYTSDYIGQLIRGGKITGTKVGRAWYVEAASFDTYLGQEGSASQPSQAPAVVSAAKEVEQETASQPTEKIEVTPADIIAEEPAAVVASEIKNEEPAAKIDMLPSVSEIDTVEVVVQSPMQSEPEIRRVPLHVAAKMQENEETSAAGLRYVVDESPSLPEIVRNTKESRVAEEVSTDDEKSRAAFAPVAQKGSKRGTLALVAALAIAVFAISALVSSALVLNLSIEAGNAASATYGFK